MNTRRPTTAACWPAADAAVGWRIGTTGQTALNVGSSVKRAGGNVDRHHGCRDGTEDISNKKAYFYQKPWAHWRRQRHASGRVFGPSSAHSGDIVLHGFGDAHGKAINVSVDRNVYLWQVTRGGGEMLPRRLIAGS